MTFDRLVFEIDRQFDLLADRASQHLFDVADRPVETQWSGLNHLSSRESEELMRQDAGAFGRDLYLLDVLQWTLHWDPSGVATRLCNSSLTNAA